MLTQTTMSCSVRVHNCKLHQDGDRNYLFSCYVKIRNFWGVLSGQHRTNVSDKFVNGVNTEENYLCLDKKHVILQIGIEGWDLQWNCADMAGISAGKHLRRLFWSIPYSSMFSALRNIKMLKYLVQHLCYMHLCMSGLPANSVLNGSHFNTHSW